MRWKNKSFHCWKFKKWKLKLKHRIKTVPFGTSLLTLVGWNLKRVLLVHRSQITIFSYKYATKKPAKFSERM